ncbi:MAG TPA: hypothetical protein VGI55_05980, partial [Solirubrobacteraceae bacterium]
SVTAASWMEQYAEATGGRSQLVPSEIDAMACGARGSVGKRKREVITRCSSCLDPPTGNQVSR